MNAVIRRFQIEGDTIHFMHETLFATNRKMFSLLHGVALRVGKIFDPKSILNAIPEP